MLEIRTCKKCKQDRSFDQFYKKGVVCFPCQKKGKYFSFVEDLNTKVKRKCLMCDKDFISTGNRKCDECNSYYHDGSHSDVSCFVSCG